MQDEILGLMREARALMLDEFDLMGIKAPRELAVAKTNLDTAILWRNEDLRLRQPVINEDDSK